MDLMDSMKFALQVGTAKTVVKTLRKVPTWPDEFRRPVDAALHLGTPRPSYGPPIKPVPAGINSHFFD